MADQVLQQLAQLPAVSLQEPEVRINYAVWPMVGSSLLSDGSTNSTTALTGCYGSATNPDVVDYYNSPPFVRPESVTVAPPTPRPLADVTSRANVATDALKGEMDSVKVQLPSPPGLSLVTSILNDQQSRGHTDRGSIRLPSPPLIAPHYDALSRVSELSPLTIISSSSPEPDDIQSEVKTPWLQLIPPAARTNRQLDRLSPEIPLVVCPKPIKGTKPLGFESKFAFPDKTKCRELNVDMDGDGFKAHMPHGKDHNQVSVVLTLSASAADNISNVIAAIADLLRIAVPPSYEICRSPSPPPYAFPTTPADLYRLGFSSTARHKEEAINIQFLMQSRPRCCQNCSTVIERTVKVKPEMMSADKQMCFESSDDYSEDTLYCSANCR